MSGGGIVHQAAFLHPELDHAVQGAAFYAQFPAEFTEMNGSVCCFDFVKDLFEHDFLQSAWHLFR